MDLTAAKTTASMKTAREIASKAKGLEDWDALREFVDTKTGGELDCLQLDLMTDWVAAINDPRRNGALGY